MPSESFAKLRFPWPFPTSQFDMDSTILQIAEGLLRHISRSPVTIVQVRATWGRSALRGQGLLPPMDLDEAF